MELEEEILSDKIDLAVLHFRSKNYTKCLLIYNEIVRKLASCTAEEVSRARKFHGLRSEPVVGRLVHPKLTSVLDQRAATFEKLDDIENAFKDARKVVLVDPTNCKGYLRLGKLHLRLGNSVDAYKAYQKGLYYIEEAQKKHLIVVPEKLFLQLKQQYSKLNHHLKEQRKQKEANLKLKDMSIKSAALPAQRLDGIQRKLDEMLPLKRVSSFCEKEDKKPRTNKTDNTSQERQGNSQDFFSWFSADVIETIFSHVPFPTILRCHLVCKAWYISLTSLPGLYRDSFLLKEKITAPEYFHGLRLMKKVLKWLYSKSIHRLRVWSTLNKTSLNRILDNIIKDEEIRLNRLDFINRDLSMEYLLSRLDSANWNLHNLATIHHLKLGINSSILCPKIVLRAFPDLMSLEIIVIDKVLRKVNKHMLPYNLEKLNQISAEADKIESQFSLEQLILVNHPGLTRENLQALPGLNTYSVTPPLIDVRFPNLSRLILVNFDFKNCETKLGSFLNYATRLKEIYFENNDNLSVKSVLLILRLYSPSFTLESLTIREKMQDQPYSMIELDEDAFSCLSNLSRLDLYGSCLSSRGLLKLLRIANRSLHLYSLNLGNSAHLCFPQDKFLSNQTILKFSDIFEVCPSLGELYLNELHLDNLSLKCLRQDLISRTGYENCRLKKIDLLFCHLVDGIGIMNLLNASYSQAENSPPLMLDELIINGLEVSKETLELVKRREIVKKIFNDPLKIRWKQFYVNSYVQDITG